MEYGVMLANAIDQDTIWYIDGALSEIVNFDLRSGKVNEEYKIEGDLSNIQRSIATKDKVIFPSYADNRLIVFSKKIKTTKYVDFPKNGHSFYSYEILTDGRYVFFLPMGNYNGVIRYDMENDLVAFDAIGITAHRGVGKNSVAGMGNACIFDDSYLIPQLSDGHIVGASAHMDEYSEIAIAHGEQGFSDIKVINDYLYLLDWRTSKIIVYSMHKKEIICCISLTAENDTFLSYFKMVVVEDTLYVIPWSGKRICCIELSTGNKEYVQVPNCTAIIGAYLVEKKIFLITLFELTYLVFDIEKRAIEEKKIKGLPFPTGMIKNEQKTYCLSDYILSLAYV